MDSSADAALPKAVARELIWVRRSRFTRVFELRSGAEVVATLRYPRAFRSFATGEAGGSRWTFAGSGVLRPRIRIRALPSGSDAGLVTLPFLGWGGRPWTVRLEDGRRLRWAATGWSDREYVLTGANGELLLRCRRPFGKPRYGPEGQREIELEIAPLARSMSGLALLVLLGRYLIR